MNPYFDYSLEELEYFKEHSEEIETGCEYNCESCLAEELYLIDKAIEKNKNGKN